MAEARGPLSLSHENLGQVTLERWLGADLLPLAWAQKEQFLRQSSPNRTWAVVGFSMSLARTRPKTEAVPDETPMGVVSRSNPVK